MCTNIHKEYIHTFPVIMGVTSILCQGDIAISHLCTDYLVITKQLRNTNEKYTQYKS